MYFRHLAVFNIIFMKLNLIIKKELTVYEKLVSHHVILKWCIELFGSLSVCSWCHAHSYYYSQGNMHVLYNHIRKLGKHLCHCLVCRNTGLSFSWTLSWLLFMLLSLAATISPSSSHLLSDEISSSCSPKLVLPSYVFQSTRFVLLWKGENYIHLRVIQYIHHSYPLSR
jgi:hypothetical protein